MNTFTYYIRANIYRYLALGISSVVQRSSLKTHGRERLGRRLLHVHIHAMESLFMHVPLMRVHNHSRGPVLETMYGFVTSHNICDHLLLQ